jgi:hypothetical protein
MNNKTHLTRISIAVFVMIFGISLLSSALQPLYGSPDETAHVVKAVATAILETTQMASASTV